MNYETWNKWCNGHRRHLQVEMDDNTLAESNKLSERHWRINEKRRKIKQFKVKNVSLKEKKVKAAAELGIFRLER
jgi:hypothetical protein